MRPHAVECEPLHFTCRTAAEADEVRHAFRDCMPRCRLIRYDDAHMRRVVSESEWTARAACQPTTASSRTASAVRRKKAGDRSHESIHGAPEKSRPLPTQKPSLPSRPRHCKTHSQPRSSLAPAARAPSPPWARWGRRPALGASATRFSPPPKPLIGGKPGARRP